MDYTTLPDQYLATLYNNYSNKLIDLQLEGAQPDKVDRLVKEMAKVGAEVNRRTDSQPEAPITTSQSTHSTSTDPDDQIGCDMRSSLDRVTILAPGVNSTDFLVSLEDAYQNHVKERPGLETRFVKYAITRMCDSYQTQLHALQGSKKVKTWVDFKTFVLDNYAVRLEEKTVSRRKWLSEVKNLKIECPDPAVVKMCVDTLWAKFGAGAKEKKPKTGAAKSRGGRRNSQVGGAALSETITSKGGPAETAHFSKSADFLGKARQKRRNRKKLNFVKIGANVVVRRRTGSLEYGPLEVITAGQHYLRVRNPISGIYGRVCRKKFQTFNWGPQRASRSVILESGEAARSQSSSLSSRSGAWSCPSLKWASPRNAPPGPYCCSSVLDPRFYPGHWFGPSGRFNPCQHAAKFRRSS